MPLEKPVFKAMYDSLMAVLGGAAAGVVFTALPAEDVVTVVVFGVMWLIVAMIGYVVLTMDDGPAEA